MMKSLLQLMLIIHLKLRLRYMNFSVQKLTFTMILHRQHVQQRVNPRTTARPGDTVKFAMDIARLHVFDKETEQVITH